MDRELVPLRDGNGNGAPASEAERPPSPTGDHITLTVAPGLAEAEIRGLLWIEQEGNELLARAYREWQRKDELFASRIDKKKKQSASLRNEIYQLIGFYSVFQGVLLTAVAQSNMLHCHNWWTAFSLSLFASIVTIAGVIQKFRAVLALEKTIRNEADARSECINRARRVLNEREKFDFAKHAKDGSARDFRQTSLRWSFVLVAIILVIFSSLFLVSIYRVLCHSNSDPPSASTS